MGKQAPSTTQIRKPPIFLLPPFSPSLPSRYQTPRSFSSHPTSPNIFSLPFPSSPISLFLLPSLLSTSFLLSQLPLLSPSPSSGPPSLVPYSRDNKFQICDRCSWSVKVTLLITSLSAGDSQYTLANVSLSLTLFLHILYYCLT